jgi:hypothetical protein
MNRPAHQEGFEPADRRWKTPDGGDTLPALILWAVWSSTVAILSRLDRAFGSVFKP